MAGTEPSTEQAPPPDPPADADSSELASVERLYEAGDFREVNRRARALADRTGNEQVKARALELQARVQTDPFVLWVWAATTLLVAGVVYYYVLR